MLNIENIVWEQFRLAKSGRMIKLLYNKEPVQLCTSTLYTPFGVKSINKTWSNFTEYYIDCSLNQANTDVANKFKDFIEKMDNKIFELVKENPEMFNTQKDTVVVDNLSYNSILRTNRDYPKLMKLQLQRDKNGNFESFIFNEKKEKIKVGEDNIEELLRKGKIFKCIIECSKVWCYNDKVGSIWNIVQLKFSENKNRQNDTSMENVYNTLMIQD